MTLITRPREVSVIEPSLGDSRYRGYHILSLLLLPPVLLAIHPNLFINPPGNGAIDAWVYLGLFLSLPEHLRRFGDTYYATRMPLLIPGFAAHRVLPPLAANYVLHFAFFYGLLFATYGLVSSGINRSAAFVAALFVGWCPSILLAMSWDYVDGPGLAFATVALCCLERANAAAALRRAGWSLGAGAALACMVGSNLTLVMLLPALGAFLFVRATSGGWRSTVSILGLAAVGAATMLGFLGVMSGLLGGRWLFLEPSIRFAGVIRSAPNPWKTAAFPWSQATWLAPPAYATTGAALTLICRRGTASSFSLASQTTLVIAVGTWILLDAETGTALLQYSYYVSYLAPLAIVAVVAQAWPPPGGASLASVIGLEVGTLAALAGVHLLMFHRGLPFWHFWEPLFGFVPPRGPVAIVTTAMGLVAVIGLQLIRPPRLRWGVFVLGVALSFAGLSKNWARGSVASAPAEFENVVLAHRFITAKVVDSRFRIWHAPSTDTAAPFRAITCTFLCTPMLVNEDLPRLTKRETDAIAQNGRLVVMVNNQTEADAARASLRTFGLDYVVVAQQELGQGDHRFLVIIANVVPVPLAHGAARSDVVTSGQGVTRHPRSRRKYDVVVL